MPARRLKDRPPKPRTKIALRPTRHVLTKQRPTVHQRAELAAMVVGARIPRPKTIPIPYAKNCTAPSARAARFSAVWMCWSARRPSISIASSFLFQLEPGFLDAGPG